MSLEEVVRSCEGSAEGYSVFQFRILPSRPFSLLAHNLIDNSFYRDEWDALSAAISRPFHAVEREAEIKRMH